MRRLLFLIVPAALVALALTAGTARAASVTTYATGLNNPRGLTFGVDGSLYVAEGGTGGTMATTPADCTQVPGLPGPGPDTGGFTSRISRISPQGVRTTVVDGLPSSQTSPLTGSLVSGAADVKFLGYQLYALAAGAGCSHGLLGTHNRLLRVNGDGTTTEIANLSAFLMANPPADDRFEQEDREPDGTWYSMVPFNGAFYAVEPNAQEIDRITPAGSITRVLDMSAQSIAAGQWIGPTSISWHGNFYFGNLGGFPIVPGSQSIWKLTPVGGLSEWASGLTTVLGTVWDRRGRLYALESMTAAGFPGPAQIGTGKVVRIDPDGSQTTVVTGLSFPTAMTFGPDGALYISNLGFGVPPFGLGQILRADLSQ
jgi:hypothetical protein